MPTHRSETLIGVKPIAISKIKRLQPNARAHEAYSQMLRLWQTSLTSHPRPPRKRSRLWFRVRAKSPAQKIYGSTEKTKLTRYIGMKRSSSTEPTVRDQLMQLNRMLLTSSLFDSRNRQKCGTYAKG